MPESVKWLVRSESDLDLHSLSCVMSRFPRMGLYATETLGRLWLDDVRKTPRDHARELSYICENLCALLGVRPRLAGSIPRGPCVIVANHISYVDPLVIASVLPCVPIAKSEVRTWPLIGDATERAGVMFVDRGSPTSGARVLRAALERLERGVSVLVFPEGTTTRGHGVLPLKRGIFGVARLARVPVVPVCLSYASPRAAWVDDQALVPHLASTLARRVTQVTASILAPVDAGAFDSADALAVHVRRSLAAQLSQRAPSNPSRGSRLALATASA
jgi:1-acyl-sn-glycerol-3-phosphate acyltransferase